ncbi:uncharacterized protein LOC117639384 [Thrips palmi]|uniref:Uncharacterized protein LOC117639384 n=1 Tax=Thrips palmi TaxID=161013 RepID=A0A6P8Y4D9_THRPL|nr:uncharacterized protein LOC117639384 [Thrips palmi]
MSLSTLGGVLVDTPSDLSVQSLLATHSNLLSQTAFLPSPTTEITLDEDDVFQCGRCKEVFTSFHQFMLHKQDHQIASSSSRILNESLALNISRDLNRNLNTTASSEHEAETCLSSTQLLKDTTCEEFDLSESLRVGGQNDTNNVLSYNSLGGSAFDDLSDDIGQPLLLSDADSLNFPIEQSILNLNDANELSSNSFAPSSIRHLGTSLLPHKLLSDETCASNNNVWLPAQKGDSGNSNFITSRFSDEQNFFADAKKVTDNINFSNHNLLTEISYPGEKQMYLNEASTNSEDITISGSLSTAVLPSEQLLLETSKDYLRSCELLEEFESTNQHELLDSASLESTNVMNIGLPLLSDSSVVSSLVNSTTPNSEVPPLVSLAGQQSNQNSHLFENDSNALQEGRNVPQTSLEMECMPQEHGDAPSCTSSRPPCGLLGCVCESLDKCSSFASGCGSSPKNTVKECTGVSMEPCETIPQDNSFISGNQNQQVESTEQVTKKNSSAENKELLNPEYTCQDLQFRRIDQGTSTGNLICNNLEVDCNFNSNHHFDNRSKNFVDLKNTRKSCFLRTGSWNEEESSAPGIEKPLNEVDKSKSKSDLAGNGHESHFEVCSVASIMKEIGILDTIDKGPPDEDSSAAGIEQDQDSSVSAESNLSLRPQTVWKSVDGSSDSLWPSALDHDYQLVQKNDVSNSVSQEQSVNKPTGNNTHDLKVTEEAQSDTKQEILSGHAIEDDNCTQSNFFPEVKTRKMENNFQCENTPSKDETQSCLNLNKICDNSSSSSNCEPTLSDCDTSNSCNAFNETNYGNSDMMSVELFNDVSHPSNIMVELDCDSNQSNIIFIDHGNFVGEQEIILPGPHGDSNDEFAHSMEHEDFSTSEDNTLYLGNIALEDNVPLPISPSWSKQESSDQERKQSLDANEAKLKKHGQLPMSRTNISMHDSEKVSGQSSISLPNSLANSSVERPNTLGKDEEFEGMCLPSVDLYDCVSVVYSAYEEESTTFSKLWNPDIRLSSELFHLETDTTDAVENGVLSQEKSPSKKRKESKSKVDKFQKSVANSSHKLLHEVSLLPSKEIKNASPCGDDKSLTILKSNATVPRKSIDGTKVEPFNSNISSRMIENIDKEMTLAKKLGTLNKSSEPSTIPVDHDKKNSSVIFFNTDNSANPVKNLKNSSTLDSAGELENPVSASVNSIPTKASRVRENLWEKRTPKLSCDHCDKKFAKHFDLRQHMRSHTGEKPFQCVVCGRSFTQKSNLTKHLSTHKIWSKSVSTLSKNAIQKVCHKKKGGTVTTTESIIFEEGEVEKNFSSSVSFKENVQSASDKDLHNDQGLHDDNDGWEIISEECIVDNSYICQFCGAAFVSYFELKTHRKTHQDEKVFFCPRNNCQKTFPDLESFVTHVNKHAPGNAFHPCNICGETFVSPPELSQHMEAHTISENSSSKKYHAKCHKCKSTFLSQEALENHLRTVSHDLPCPECKRIFSCERSLRRHLRTHSTVHPFVCKECGKRFKTVLYLNTHLAMHRDDKPFACSQCPAKFARKDRLSRHLKIHSDGEQCPFQAHLKCNRQFTRPDKLKAHVLSHTEHQLTNCSFCKRQIAKFSVNKRHYTISNQQFEDSPSDTLDLPVMAVSCDVSSAEINSNVTINAKSNTSLNFNGSITLGMLQDKQSVDINNLSCENVETNSLNFDHIVCKKPAKNKKVPTIGIIVMPLSQCMPGSGQQILY